MSWWRSLSEMPEYTTNSLPSFDIMISISSIYYKKENQSWNFLPRYGISVFSPSRAFMASIISIAIYTTHRRGIKKKIRKLNISHTNIVTWSPRACLRWNNSYSSFLDIIPKYAMSQPIMVIYPTIERRFFSFSTSRKSFFASTWRLSSFSLGVVAHFAIGFLMVFFAGAEAFLTGIRKN